jgi:hypothetical protein
MSAAQRIRIEDLRAPVLTPAQRAALAYGRDFGAEPAAVREPFGFYLERFPVKVEVS